MTVYSKIRPFSPFFLWKEKPGIMMVIGDCKAQPSFFSLMPGQFYEY